MEKGHWYIDENGHHYFVKEGQSPKEGWEATKRRKMINGGKYQTSEDGENWKDSTKEEYEKYEADEMEFDNDNREELNPVIDENPQQSDEGSNIYTPAGLLNFKDIISNRTDEFLEELKNQPGLKESIIAIIDKMRKK